MTTPPPAAPSPSPRPSTPAASATTTGGGLREQTDIINLRNRMAAAEKSGDYNARNFVDVPSHMLRNLLDEVERLRRTRAAIPKLSPGARETILRALTWYVPDTGDAPDEFTREGKRAVAQAIAEIEALPK